jgi:glutamine cyclotransferase
VKPNLPLLVSLCGLLLAAAAVIPANSAPVTEYRYRILEKKPHSREDYVQGLEIRDNRLYQSTGRYGESRLQVFDLASGLLLHQRALPDELFGEGITVLEDRIYQMTWLAGTALVYRRDDLKPITSFAIQGQGWGLTNDGRSLIYSDGSDVLRYLAPATGQVERTLTVRRNGEPLLHLNELEWTPDYILANVWQTNLLVMIDDTSGRVVGQVDLEGLLSWMDRRENTDVLNGIALDHRPGQLWVTGKNWPWLYRIELEAKTR